MIGLIQRRTGDDGFRRRRVGCLDLNCYSSSWCFGRQVERGYRYSGDEGLKIHETLSAGEVSIVVVVAFVVLALQF